MRVTLKDYQSRCLATLEGFLLRTRDVGAKRAFNESESRPMDRWARRQEYGVIPGWPASEAFPPTFPGWTPTHDHRGST